MKTKNKLLSWLLALTMIIGMLPAGAMAAPGATDKQALADAEAVIGGVTVTASFGELTDGYHVKAGDTVSNKLVLTFSEPMRGFTVRLNKAGFDAAITSTDEEGYSFASTNTSEAQLQVGAPNNGNVDVYKYGDTSVQSGAIRIKDAEAAARGNYVLELTITNLVPETGNDIIRGDYVTLTTYLVVADAEGNTDLLPGEGEEPDPEPVKYSVTCAQVEHGTVTLDVGGTTVVEGVTLNDVAEGTKVTVNATADEGYEIVGTYPEFEVSEDVTVEVRFQEKQPEPEESYDLNVGAGLEGKVSFLVNGVAATQAHEGDIVEIVVDSSVRVTGMSYLPATLAVTDGMFTMPAEAVTVNGKISSTVELVVKDAVEGEDASMNGVTFVETGSTVTVYVKLDATKRVVELTYAEKTSPDVIKAAEMFSMVAGGEFTGYRAYTFTMPAEAIVVTVKFADIPEEPVVSIGGDKYNINGQVVLTDPIAGALDGKLNTGVADAYKTITVTLRQKDYEGEVIETVNCAADGTFKFEGVELKDKNYELQASIDNGHGTDIMSNVAEIALPAENIEALKLALSLYYDKDLNDDGKSERIYAGADCKFDTEDDYYGLTDGGKIAIPANTENIGTDKVYVHIGDDKVFGGADCDDYYMWQLTETENHADENGNTKIFVNDDKAAGAGAGSEAEIKTDNEDYYIATIKCMKVEGGEAVITEQSLSVHVGVDNKPGTADDRYMHDINAVAPSEVVFAGEDGRIGTADDFYKAGDKTVFIGEDAVAGNQNDFYMVGDIKVFIGLDRIPGTEDDSYEMDIDNDGLTERVFVGADKEIGGDDDTYFAHIPSMDADTKAAEHETAMGIEFDDDQIPEGFVKVTVKADPAEDEFKSSLTYGVEPDTTVIDITVYVGEDGEAGTADDHYDYEVPAPGKDAKDEGTTETVTVIVGEDGKPGSSSNTYELDANMDGEDELVHVGGDGVPGTDDDWYDKDVNGDGNNERVEAGDDGRFSTEDDHYDAIVNTPDDTQEKVPVYAGEDGKFSEPENNKDDWYPWDTNKDGQTDPDIYDGDDTHDKVFIDGDSLVGTEDDYYFKDVDPDLDGDEKIHVGEDGIPGTDDDWYEKDINGDGKPDIVYPGDNGEFGPGEDGKDDHYTQDNDGDGKPDIDVNDGGDGELGTKDDWYETDIDNDGETERVNVGEDGIANTGDDNWVSDVKLNANGGSVTPTRLAGNRVTKDGKILEVLTFTELPTPTRSGSYSFSGWDKTLDQLKAATGDVTVTASWRYTGYSGGGGGGSYTPRTYKVTFNTNGGSPVGAIEVTRNSTIKAQTSTKFAYVLEGWYQDEALTKAWNFEKDKVTKDITLYAKWTYKGPFTYLIEDHVAYIAGFPNGMVGPEENITRAEVVTIFYRLLNEETLAQYKTGLNDFTDVEPDAWYNEAVSTLAKMGVIVGKGNNLFDPDADITRAEFATICARFDLLEPVEGKTFTDVPAGYWAYETIGSAAAKGWINGVGNGKFEPARCITRAEAVTLVNRVLKRTPKDVSSFGGLEYKNWPDNQDANAWYYLNIIEAGTAHDCEYDSANYETWTSLQSK